MDNVTWRDLNRHLQTISEEDCLALLREEQRGKRRQSYVMRLYGRYTQLREQRERADLFLPPTPVPVPKKPASSAAQKHGALRKRA